VVHACARRGANVGRSANTERPVARVPGPPTKLIGGVGAVACQALQVAVVFAVLGESSLGSVPNAGPGLTTQLFDCVILPVMLALPPMVCSVNPRLRRFHRAGYVEGPLTSTYH
jgi:hypothetical protein